MTKPILAAMLSCEGLTLTEEEKKLFAEYNVQRQCRKACDAQHNTRFKPLRAETEGYIIFAFLQLYRHKARHRTVYLSRLSVYRRRKSVVIRHRQKQPLTALCVVCRSAYISTVNLKIGGFCFIDSFFQLAERQSVNTIAWAISAFVYVNIYTYLLIFESTEI